MQRALVVVMDRTILGGAELSMLELMRVVRSWGIEIYLITGEQGALFSEFEKVSSGILITKFAYPTKPNSWFYLPKFLWRTRHFLKKIQLPITILASDIFSLWSALWLQNKLRPVFALWQSEFNATNNKDVLKWMRYGAKRAKGLLANEYLATLMNNSGLLSPHIVNAVNIPINTERWNPALYSNAALKKQFGWTENKKIALCVGRITPQKGQLDLVENFYKRPELMRDWQLIFAGPIENNVHQDHFEKAVACIPPESVRYIGARDDIPELMASADCVIYPGRYHEGFCLTVAESLLIEKPVIAYGGGAIPYLLGDNYPGLIPYENCTELYDCWQKIHLEDIGWKKKTHREKVLSLASRARFCHALKQALQWT